MSKVLGLGGIILGVVVLGTPINALGGPIKGDIKLGYVASSGNSESESLAFTSKFGFEREGLSHKFSLDVFSGAQNGTTSAERYTAAYQVNTEITATQSAFGRIDYDDDRFSGFDYQAAATIGLTSKWSVPEGHTLTTDVGVGMRSSKLSLGGSEDEGIIRLAAAYALVVNDNSKFEQTLSADIGEESTISKAVSSYSVAISDALSLDVGLHFKHVSEPAFGAKSLDRETTVSLAYSF